MAYVLIVAIQTFQQVFSLLLIVYIVLGYFMSPYHPVRATLARLMEPLLEPIRRVVPLVGMFDFSPMVLIILVQLISTVLINILMNLR